MKTRVISIVALLLVGVATALMLLMGSARKQQTYDSNIQWARASAEKKIPYNARQFYKKAFEVKCEDEQVYQEYLAQSKLLGKDFYDDAVKEYLERFPMSPHAYDLYCDMQYERGSFKEVLTKAVEAKDKEIATEHIRDLYLECEYMIRNVASGFTEAQPFLQYTAQVKVGDLYGYITEYGTFMLDPAYEKATPMLNGCMAVFEDDEWHIVNNQGFVVARPSEKLDSLSFRSEDLMAACKGGKYGYLTPSMEVPKEFPFDYAGTMKSGVAAVKKGKKWALINPQMENITDFVFDEIYLDEFDACVNYGIIFAKKDGVYKMLDTAGNVIGKESFQDVHPFASEDPAAVKINGKWGFVNMDGSIAVKPQYEDARSYSIGLAGVLKDGKWGYVNQNGDIRVEPQFEDCKPFSANGIAPVKEEGLWKYVQLLGYQQ